MSPGETEAPGRSSIELDTEGGLYPGTKGKGDNGRDFDCVLRAQGMWAKFYKEAPPLTEWRMARARDRTGGLT